MAEMRTAQTVAAPLHGEPITNVIERPVVSNDVIISGAFASRHFTGLSVSLEVDRPCSAAPPPDCGRLTT